MSGICGSCAGSLSVTQIRMHQMPDARDLFALIMMVPLAGQWLGRGRGLCLPSLLQYRYLPSFLMLTARPLTRLVRLNIHHVFNHRLSYRLKHFTLPTVTQNRLHSLTTSASVCSFAAFKIPSGARLYFKRIVHTAASSSWQTKEPPAPAHNLKSSSGSWSHLGNSRRSFAF